MIKISDLGHASERPLARNSAETEHGHVVAPIIEAVKRKKDEALFHYARKFDGLSDQSLRVEEGQLKSAAAAMSRQMRAAAETAAILLNFNCLASASKSSRRAAN